MRRTIAMAVATIILGVIVTIGWSELYSRNETFRRGYVSYSNTVASQIYDTLQSVGIHAPKVVVVE